MFSIFFCIILVILVFDFFGYVLTFFTTVLFLVFYNKINKHCSRKNSKQTKVSVSIDFSGSRVIP